MFDEDGDRISSDVAALNQQFDAIDDPRECYLLVLERIRQYHDNGTRVPDDLAQLEHQLMCECMAESQGR